MAAVTDLVTNFSFTGSTAPLTGFIGALNQGIGLVFGFDKGLAGLTQSFIDMTHEIVNSIDPLVQLQRETGVSIERLQEMGFVASQNGSSIDAVTSTVSSLSQKIGEASIKGSEDFARLGISVFGANGKLKTADVVLGDIRSRFKSLGLDMQQQKTLASSLGIDGTLIQSLNLTDSAVESLTMKARGLGITTQEEGDALAKLANNFEAVRFGVDALKRSIVMGIEPAIGDLTEGFIDFLVANKELISDGISNTINGISKFFGAVKNSLPVLGLLTVGLLSTEIAATALAVTMGVLTSPITLTIAAIVATIAIVDDLVVAMNGGKSVIRDFFLEFFNIDIAPVIRHIVDSFIKGLAFIKNAFKEVFGFFTSFGDKGVSVENQQTINAVGGGGTSSNLNQDVVININASNAEDAKRGVIEGLDLNSQLQSANDLANRGGR